MPTLPVTDTGVTLPLLLPVSLTSSSPSGYVRPAKIRDLQQLTDVLASSFYPPEGWKHWLYPVFHFGIYEDLKQRLHSRPRHYQCWVAVAPSPSHRSDAVAGTLEMACRRYNLWAFNQPPQIYLSNLAVRQQYRRQGLACLLLQAAERQALDWGFRELYLHVMVDNYQARRLYHKMGYRVQQIETTVLSLFNLQPQRLLLRKVLSPTAQSSRLPSVSV